MRQTSAQEHGPNVPRSSQTTQGTSPEDVRPSVSWRELRVRLLRDAEGEREGGVKAVNEDEDELYVRGRGKWSGSGRGERGRAWRRRRVQIFSCAWSDPTFLSHFRSSLVVIPHMSSGVLEGSLQVQDGTCTLTLGRSQCLGIEQRVADNNIWNSGTVMFNHIAAQPQGHPLADKATRLDTDPEQIDLWHANPKTNRGPRNANRNELNSPHETGSPKLTIGRAHRNETRRTNDPPKRRPL
ncbi:hypothetical protein DFP72DRAFT_855330 [Ephemerocybe angulata]|uniref:Uncharacterized protein n=1 Tax=Ephemerocybe angulata TaxID=980116 RepID=A0A8H6HHT8_9AGAR|nr:hypothetical protein DFP72DRAFT_855330 [Tulosesus angulatus]